uniref:Nucleotide-binding alpha-beta plait domain-containing protein n=1 Tax=Tanacetum cinerariifolium TaxID=118510 RepID=A0A699HFU5_TANCI|nr:nucleotide-binding alpha-beta plait domain-containing protein [Tanacetum cinerariifolium]
MAMDLISVQASSVASESAFSTSGRVLSIRKTRLTLTSLEMCMCLKVHLDTKERKQDKCPLETPFDIEEDVLDDEVQRNEAIPLSDEEIALDANASSEGTLSPRRPRTKEDDVAKISTSVYITNFPESVSAKELFHACKQYGHVVDSFILTKRSKNGKRFGFVRFIIVFNKERLVNNLCTVWVDRYKLHANIARFQRPPAKKERDGVKKTNVFSSPKEYSKANVNTWGGNSYMGALKGVKQVDVEDLKSGPALLLGDDCVVSKDLSNALLGRVKEFASLANLKLALGNEGFVDIDIKYMGQLWVMLEFNSEETINKFWDNVSVTSWFSQIIEATTDFEIEGRIASIVEEFKIIHRGKIYLIGANKTPSWVPDFTDESDDDDQDEINSNDDDTDIHKFGGAGDNSDVEGVPETLFEDERLVKSHVEGESIDKNVDKSKDPFNIYPLLSKNKHMDGSVNKSGSSLKYPPGFTPIDGNGENSTPAEDGMIQNVKEVRTCNREENNDAFSDIRVNSYTKEAGTESLSSGHFKKSELLRTGGSILGLLDETKMENMDSFCVRQCWGNLAFDHVHSDAVGNSGDILCVWDPNSFCKNNVTLSDYFVIIRGCCRLTGQNFLLIAMYAPQDSRDKQSLWDYLQQEIGKWKEEVIIMGDFNEVRSKSDRELQAVDLINNSGQGTEKETSTRVDIINKIQRCEKLDSMEMAQKAKVKWAVEGDKDFGFFHGMLNKKRSIINIRGVIVDGMWVDSPNKVKKEFLDHFNNQFCKHVERKATLQMEFHKQIHSDQQRELESEVTNDEIKKAVWECGTDKSPGPDGFTFGFFRRFWYLVEREVYDAVSPTKEFQFGKGLKQGDMLSPFLFILIMESLHPSFQRVVDAGMFHGIKLDGSVNLSHMFYADDAVFVGQWSENNISMLVHVLECFHRVSRNLIDVKIFPEGEHKTRWIRYVPIKVNTHAWKVMSNSLPTRFNISRRGIDIDSITCVNCDMGVETTSHLFLSCDMAQQVARLITRWWDVPDLEIDSYGSCKIWMVNL